MMIEIKNLSFSYGKKKQSVFNDFSLTLDKGSVYGLLGKNGTGKSTLLYLMTGLLRPQAGQVLYKGVDVSMRYPLTLQDMFLVPEEFALPSVSLKRYLKLNTPFYPNFSNELLNACLHDFDMNEDIHLGELSMGQKKKVFMCFALATNTSLLVMDEPISWRCRMKSGPRWATSPAAQSTTWPPRWAFPRTQSAPRRRSWGADYTRWTSARSAPTGTLPMSPPSASLRTCRMRRRRRTSASGAGLRIS